MLTEKNTFSTAELSTIFAPIFAAHNWKWIDEHGRFTVPTAQVIQQQLDNLHARVKNGASDASTGRLFVRKDEFGYVVAGIEFDLV